MSVFFFLKLLTRSGVRVFTLTFVLAVLICLLRVKNKVVSYVYCKYANVAHTSNASNMAKL